MASERRRGVVAAGALLLLIGVMTWWLWPTQAGRGAPSARVDRGGRERAPAPEPAVPIRVRPGVPAQPAQAPIIDAVTIEKTELCEGEENLVTVRAHAALPEDDVHLHGVIDGIPGLSVPIIAQRRDPDAPPPVVLVFGRDGTRASADIPAFEVKDCTAARTLAVSYRLRLNTNAEFELDASIANPGPGQPFVATSYQWEFGDGSSETTSEPTVVHDYGKRPQRGVYAHMLVQVTARSASGDILVGRRAMQFHNAEYANLVYAGVVTLVVELTPRFPRLEGSRVIQGVRLWHHQPEPVRIERIQARRNSLAPGSQPVLSEVPVASLLGGELIPPAGLAVDLTLDLEADPDAFSIDYLLSGHSAEGYPVESTFSVMRPPVPTLAQHTPIEDPAMIARILRAREVLGKELVTDEDLLALQRRGLLSDFKPTADDPEAKLPPVYAP